LGGDRLAKVTVALKFMRGRRGESPRPYFLEYSSKGNTGKKGRGGSPLWKNYI